MALSYHNCLFIAIEMDFAGRLPPLTHRTEPRPTLAHDDTADDT
jgi:hypothetical protein